MPGVTGISPWVGGYEGQPVFTADQAASQRQRGPSSKGSRVPSRSAERGHTMQDVSPILAVSALNGSFNTAYGTDEASVAEQLSRRLTEAEKESFDVDSPSMSNIPKPPSFVQVEAGGRLVINSP